MRLILAAMILVMGWVAYEVCKPMEKREIKNTEQTTTVAVTVSPAQENGGPSPSVVMGEVSNVTPMPQQQPVFDMEAAKAKLLDIKVRLATVSSALQDLHEKNLEAIPALGSETIKKASDLKKEIIANQDKISELKDKISSNESKAKSLANEIRSSEYTTVTRYVSTGRSGVVINGVVQNSPQQVVQERIKVADTTRGNTVTDLVNSINAMKAEVAALKDKTQKLSLEYESMRSDVTKKLTSEFNSLQGQKNDIFAKIKANEQEQ